MLSVKIGYNDGQIATYYPDNGKYQVFTNYIRFNDSVIGQGVIDTIVPFSNVTEIEIKEEKNNE